MKKERWSFPFYLVYTPIITWLMLDHIWKSKMEDGSMSTLEQVPVWFGIDNELIVNILMLVMVLAAIIYVLVRWFFTNKTLRGIKDVTDTAPADIKNHISDAQSALQKSMMEDKVALHNRLSDINAKTDSMARDVRDIMKERPAAPIQQDQLLGQIVAMYAQHDADQKQIQELKDENLRLAQENQELKSELKELKPDQPLRPRLR